MEIKFIKKTPFAIDETVPHKVEEEFGRLMVANGYAVELKKDNIVQTTLKNSKSTMKKLFSLLLIFAFAFSAAGQSNVVSTMAGSGDTVTNSGTDYVVSQVKAYAKTVSIQAKVTKISGTVAGTALLSGSNDGVNYSNIGTDTLTLTDVTTNTKVWVLDGSPFEYYKITVLGSGTQSCRIYGYLLPNQTSLNLNSVVSMKSGYGLTVDTVTNTATNTVKVQVQSWFQTVSIQAVVTKLSGTAAGTVTLQGSNDGVNYVTVNTGYLTNPASLAPYTTGGAATLSVANQTTNTKLFVVNGSPYEYYRLSYTGSGTMSCTLKGYVLANK